MSRSTIPLDSGRNKAPRVGAPQGYSEDGYRGLPESTHASNPRGCLYPHSSSWPVRGSRLSALRREIPPQTRHKLLRDLTPPVSRSPLREQEIDLFCTHPATGSLVSSCCQDPLSQEERSGRLSCHAVRGTKWPSLVSCPSPEVVSPSVHLET